MEGHYTVIKMIYIVIYLIVMHIPLMCVHRRKRGERDVADTPGDVIVRKLTVERIEELKRIIQEEKSKYRYPQSSI